MEFEEVTRHFKGASESPNPVSKVHFTSIRAQGAILNSEKFFRIPPIKMSIIHHISHIPYLCGKWKLSEYTGIYRFITGFLSPRAGCFLQWKAASSLSALSGFLSHSFSQFIAHTHTATREKKNPVLTVYFLKMGECREVLGGGPAPPSKL